MDPQNPFKLKCDTTLSFGSCQKKGSGELVSTEQHRGGETEVRNIICTRGTQYIQICQEI